jgi:hypothetical protein
MDECCIAGGEYSCHGIIPNPHCPTLYSSVRTSRIIARTPCVLIRIAARSEKMKYPVWYFLFFSSIKEWI